MILYIKFIGIAIMLVGIALLATVLLSGRKGNISGVREELEMITGAGYATTHTEVKQTRTVLENTPVKVPPRKRALSREAADILKQVEEERQAERDKLPSRTVEKKASRQRRLGSGTAVLEPRSKRKGTDILDPGAASSGLRKKKATDVLVSAPSSGKGTDILAGEPQAKEDTDVLITSEDPERESYADNNKAEPSSDRRISNGVIEKRPEGRRSTDVLEKPRSRGNSTDVLIPEDPHKGAAPQRRETAVLGANSQQSRKGTDVLTKRAGTAVLTEDAEDK